MKRGWVFLAALCAAVLCTSCGGSSGPERDLDKMLTHLKNNQYSRAEQYTVEGTLNLSLQNKNAKNFYKSIFSTINYVITDSTVTDDTAQVTVTVTMLDMDTLISDASLEALDSTFSGGKGGRVNFYAVLNEKMNNGQISYETNTVTVYMVKDRGKWKVNMTKSSSFADAITGGVGELIGY